MLQAYAPMTVTKTGTRNMPLAGLFAQASAAVLDSQPNALPYRRYLRPRVKRFCFSPSAPRVEVRSISNPAFTALEFGSVRATIPV